MKHDMRKISWLVMGIAFLVILVPAVARSAVMVAIPDKEVIPGDKYVRALIFRNEGTIKGDLMCWAQNISSRGTVEGDVIGAGQDMDLAGNVMGNVRAAGASVNISGQIGKNATLFGGAVNFVRNSVVNGNVTAFGGKVNLDGTVKGNVRVNGHNVMLSGEFFGNVDVNSKSKSRFDRGPRSSDAKLTVLPGTIIHGTLTFRGANADIQKGAKISNLQWDKSKAVTPDQQKREIYRYLWKFLRLLVTIAVYFLIGLLFFKFFPVFFGRAAGFITEKPWNAIGYGLFAVFSTIVTAIACVILLVFSLVMSPAFGMVSSITAIGFYTLVFFLASIPVAVWLGTLVFREKPLAYRLVAGLIMVNVSVFILRILNTVPAIGAVFPALAFVVKFGVILLGSGALLRAIWEAHLSAKKNRI